MIKVYTLFKTLNQNIILKSMFVRLIHKVSYVLQYNKPVILLNLDIYINFWYFISR